MGAFHGSVHIRSRDLDGVRRALEKLAAEKGTKFLLAPAIGAWIGVYPSDHGQDLSVSAALAAHLPVPVLHLLVHDDGVFAYTLYDAGGAIDQYCSDPDYFEPSTAARRRETAGRSEVLAALVGKGDAATLARVLDRAGREATPFRAAWQMTRVAEALGIANVVTSYENLRDGETRGIKGWKDFVSVPDLSAEKNAKRRQQAQVAAATKRLQRDGHLLLALKRGVGAAPPSPVFCASPRGGFFLAWREGHAIDAVLELWQAPWEKPAETGLVVSSLAHPMRASRSGRYVAVAYWRKGWSASVHDLDSREAVTTVALPSAAEHIFFTENERLLVCRSQAELRLVSLTEEHAVRALVLEGGRSATVHPDGQWLVADLQAGHSVALALVDLRSARIVRRLTTRANNFEVWRAAHAAGRIAVSGFHPHEVPNKLDFTADGRLLVMAVAEGLRIYSWPEVLRANETLPAPIASADTDVVQVETDWLQQTYGFDIDRDRARVYFSGLDGRVRALHLETGRNVSRVFGGLGPVESQ